MRDEEVLQMLEVTGYPVAYHHWGEGAEPNKPYIVYLYPVTTNFSADGIVYQSINKLDIELYTECKDPKAERQVEAVLKEYGFLYEKNETYIESEKMYEVLYETEVLIDE